MTPNPGTVEPEELVTGIIAIEAVAAAPGAAEPFKIQTVYSEFNSGAWLYDIGTVSTRENTSASRSACTR